MGAQRLDLEAVKRERAHLLEQLARAKEGVGKAGGEAQQNDIRRLRRDLALKKDKLNEIRRVRAPRRAVCPFKEADLSWDRPPKGLCLFLTRDILALEGRRLGGESSVFPVCSCICAVSD